MSLGCVLLLLEQEVLRSLRAYVGVVTIHLAVEAHDRLILLEVVLVESQQFLKVIKFNLLLLAIG